MALVNAAKLLVSAVFALAVPVAGNAVTTAAPDDPGCRFFVMEVPQQTPSVEIIPTDGCCR
ncbi:MAG: hypothetical protein ACRDT4_10720 [Micromonosporaceae bacterium]